MIVLAIDLGNGEIKVAVWDPVLKMAVFIRSNRGEKSWPSDVAITSEGRVLLGKDAREHGITHPDEVAHGFKMHLADSSKRYFKNTKSAAEVATIVFKEVVAAAAKERGDKIDALLVTRPANFREDATKALIGCAEATGLPVLAVIPEPVAAAYMYCHDEWAGEGRVSYVCCVDLGHGTLDVCILRAELGKAVAVATRGVPQLGGRDFSNELLKLVLAKVAKACGKQVVLKDLDPQVSADLHKKIEDAKHALSNQPETTVTLFFNGKAQSIRIEQMEFKLATEHFVKQMLDCMEAARAESGIPWSKMESVVLAGGPFLCPWLQDPVANATGLAPRVKIDTTLVVSFGAALHGFHLAKAPAGKSSNGSISDRELILINSTCHDLGVAIIDETSPTREAFCSLMVKAGTEVPCTHTEHFRLERANQSDVVIQIVQGAAGTPANKCLHIGTLRLRGLPPEAQRSERIEITFTFDKNTLVRVLVKDTISGICDSTSFGVAAK